MSVYDTHVAYRHQLERLTQEQKTQLNMKEDKIGRKLLPCEIVAVFKLEPSGELKVKKRRLSDEIENDSHWANE